MTTNIQPLATNHSGDGSHIPTPSYTQACERCNSKKVKCLYDGHSKTCINCASIQAECRPRVRKKRKTAASVNASAPSTDAAQRDLGTSQEAANSMQSVQTPAGPQSARAPMLPSPETLDPGSSTYIGRAHYEGHEIVDESYARSYTAHRQNELSPSEQKTLEIWEAFHFPPRSVHDSLIEAFLEHCHPWMPTLDDAEKQQCLAQGASPLLLQSMFLAASRVVSAASLLNFATPADFYHRARALYWVAHEKDPLVVIKAITMLHWWNPDGPAFVSYDTSEYWLKIGACLAFQVGLHKEPQDSSMKHIRRRIWWSLVARDAMISFSRGRPRAIRLEESDVQRPQLDDFPGARADGELFIAYTDICCILGTIVELRSKAKLSASKSIELDNALFRWTRTLPTRLHLVERRPYQGALEVRPHDFRARQLHVIYFACVVILARSQAPRNSNPPAALLAASFIAGIFEDFLARDLVRVLSPTFTSFSFVAALTMLALEPQSPLWTTALADLEVLQTSLCQLSDRWKSAIGASKAVKRAMDSLNTTASATASRVRKLMPSEEDVFQGYPTALCKMRMAYDTEVDRSQDVAGLGAPYVENGGQEAFQSTMQPDASASAFNTGDDWFSLAPFVEDTADNYFWSDWSFGR